MYAGYGRGETDEHPHGKAGRDMSRMAVQRHDGLELLFEFFLGNHELLEVVQL